MKKLLVMILAAAMAVSMVACSSDDSSSSESSSSEVIESTSSEETSSEDTSSETTESPLADMMAQITDVPSLEIATMESEMTADNWEYNTKTTMPEGAVGLVSDAAISAQAHSVVLIQMPEGSDVEAYAQEILEKNTDPSQPSKWVCVQAEKVEVATKDNIILFVQSFETTANEILAKFNEM